MKIDGNTVKEHIVEHEILGVKSQTQLDTRYIKVAGGNSAANIIIENDYQDGDITFKVNDGGVDTTVMTLDGATGRVGIGSTSPASLLDVHGTAWLRGSAGGTSGLYVKSDGNVGIGTTGPGAKLEVYGSTQMGSPTSSSLTLYGGDWSGSKTETNLCLGKYDNGLSYSWNFQVDTTSANLNILRNYGGKQSTLFLQRNSGNVGIGTTSPTAKLHIDQATADAAIPVLTVDQADVSEEAVRFIGQAASATLTQTFVNASDVSTFTPVGYLKIYIQDDGNQITDGAYYLQFGTIA